MPTTFQRYEDAAGECRWRLRHRNGMIVADSGEGDASRHGVRDATRRVKRHVTGARVEELDADA